MRRLVEFSDIACIENLRMSRNAFGKLCLILQNQGGLQDSKHVPLSSQVAMFLSILAHHKKNRTVKYDFIRSGRTISKHFHRVLNAVLRLTPCCLPILPLCHQTTIVRGGSGLSNGEGFLSPYRGVRYHLKEWESGNNTPQNHQEFFNMKHASARNVIERTFGLLKARWAILKDPLRSITSMTRIA
ncbi:UNVERIFIED_CONTAM: hypothetical protein Sangu_3256100 [Sesamum angustifolium]|uniref:DDE Tnp4 domain-containing protein n=1 Tax=Sesamum angustifolium TaxID=2727405 RepID=A0AAW2JC67_9LAMI